MLLAPFNWVSSLNFWFLRMIIYLLHMQRLIFSDEWFATSWSGWNDTLLGADLGWGLQMCEQLLQIIDSWWTPITSKPQTLNALLNSCMSSSEVYFLSCSNNTWVLSSTCMEIGQWNIHKICHVPLYVFYWLEISFILFFMLLISLKFYNSYFQLFLANQSFLTLNYEIFLLVQINMIFIKFESLDEAFNVIIFWPWCLMLVFTHLIFWNNNEFFFIFIEWGLPVVYGYFIICEYFWNFGSYFFIYLNGTRGRRSLLFTIIEDLVAFFILIARVSLQMIRGLICGLYHDFFREITEYIIDTWDIFFLLYSWRLPFFSMTPFFDLMLFFINVYLIAFTLLFIYFVLFLQLLFLLIAVWLFARCWFISKTKPNLSMWRGLFK